MLIVLALNGVVALAAELPLPPPTGTPILVLNHPRAHAPVYALAFSPDGSTLYAGGHDKLVRRFTAAGGKWNAADPLRVPLGTGNAGAVNAAAASPDGRWVAVAGRAPVRGEVWAGGQDGVVTLTRTLPPPLKRDFGVVYLFDRANPDRGGRVIRGQQSEVRALAFADPAPVTGPVLVTAGIEWDAAGKEFGTVRAFDVDTGKELDARGGFPTTTRPGLGAWATPAGGLRVAVAWPGVPTGEKLVAWDAPGGEAADFAEPLYNGPLAVRAAGGAATEVVTGGYHYKATPGKPVESFGRIVVRPTDPAAKERFIDLEPNVLPLAVATLPPKAGAALAVLAQVPKGDGAGRPTELRLLGANGRRVGEPVVLTGVTTETRPVLAASPDGRFVAVGGFTNHRVEVFDVARWPAREVLPGEPAGFDRVRFLPGDKLWVGGAAGGVALDVPNRTAAPNDGKGKIDGPPPVVEPVLTNPDPAKKVPDRVTVVVANAARTVILPDGERPTAAALHPGGPAWDAALGPVLAVAHTNDRNARTLVTLYSIPPPPAVPKPLLELGGPSLPVRGLAFSGTRPLLAAVGEDRTAFVWSLRDLRRTFPILDGVLVTARGNEVVVASVDPKGAAAGRLAAGDVIVAVGGAGGGAAAKTPLDLGLAVRVLMVGGVDGGLTPVRTPTDLLVAVRATAGGGARVAVRGKAGAIPVPVTAAVGHRHPLVSVWIDPELKKGGHDWVGWTQAGPYDASSDAAEERIGWVTATGNPARPVAFAEAREYQKDYLKKDIIRFVLETGDVGAALRLQAAMHPPKPPDLVVRVAPNGEKVGDRTIHTRKPDGLDVSLLGADNVFVLDRAVIRWSAVAPDGTATPAQEVPFAAGQAFIDLKGYDWPRGERRFRVALHLLPDARPAAEPTLTAAQVVAPPPPGLVVRIDGREVKHGVEIEAKGNAVEVAMTVTPGPGGPAGVVVAASGLDKPLVPVEKPPGVFAPVTVNVKPTGKTVILVTAGNREAGADPHETRWVEVLVLPPPPPVPPPKVSLSLVTPHQPAATPDAPHVVHIGRVKFTASVQAARPVTGFDWDLGDGKWVAGKLDKDGTDSRDVDLPTDGKALAVRVRAQSGKAEAEHAVRVVYAALPEVTLKPPSPRVTTPELTVGGPIDVPGTVPFDLRVVVTSAHAGRAHEVRAVVDAAGKTWHAVVPLAPGENTVGFVVRNRWGEVRKSGVRAVTYVRPPVVVAAPLKAGAGMIADAVVFVASHPDAPPTELRVNDDPVAFTRVPLPSPCGLHFSVLRAPGASVKTNGVRAEAVGVAVSTAEASQLVAGVRVDVVKEVVKAVKPPTVVLSTPTGPIAPGAPLVTDQPRFAFAVRVASETPLSRAEVRRTGVSGAPEAVPGFSPRLSVPAGDGYELTADVAVDLRRGANAVRVVVANGGNDAEYDFTVSYTPPPVRIVIESVTESRDGKPVELKAAPGAPLQTEGAVVHVSGRVVWETDDPALRDPNLVVVFHANRVAHLPVRPAPRADGTNERAFAGLVYLNATDTRVRVELRSAGGAGAVPTQNRAAAELRFDCKKPLAGQRLHVLVIAPGVAGRDRAALAGRVVGAVGGTIPPNAPGFERSTFKHPSFSQATLYRILVEDVDSGDVVGLLKDFESNIRDVTRRAGNEWLNDMVVVYYQGVDRIGDDRRLLQTTKSLYYEGNAAVKHMVRVDDLRPVAGVQFALLNVTDEQPGAKPAAGPRTDEVSILRYPWRNATALDRLPDLLQKGVAQKQLVGDVVGWVKDQHRKEQAAAGEPLDTLTDELNARVIGLKVP